MLSSEHRSDAGHGDGILRCRELSRSMTQDIVISLAIALALTVPSLTRRPHFSNSSWRNQCKEVPASPNLSNIRSLGRMNSGINEADLVQKSSRPCIGKMEDVPPHEGLSIATKETPVALKMKRSKSTWPGSNKRPWNRHCECPQSGVSVHHPGTRTLGGRYTTHFSYLRA